ncbi:MAG: hypothetical protein E7773_14820 [Sphingomonas sp.]|uniref:hypothetical protein n=1 Tax=Sphingomonas sp. TaxID=28214 RepID=UPI00120E06EF|nr:hypothetical protein [Sphingomonas sp.]THD34459.1 MAG: hypothetical protein E7773_14820 [Sphingomonas sp.]
MFSTTGEQQIQKFLAATRRMIDPHRTILAASTPYIVAGSSGPAGITLIAGMQAADGVGADYIHLEFAPGREHEGPVNVAVGMMREGVGHIRRTCRFWIGEDGRVELVATVAGKHATMTFDPDGMDTRPGKPTGDLEAGYGCAATRLRELAAVTPAAANGVIVRMALAA